jgi:hypothetical protein
MERGSRLFQQPTTPRPRAKGTFAMAMPLSYPTAAADEQHAFALPPQLVADMAPRSAAFIALRAALQTINPAVCTFYMDDYLPALRSCAFPNPAPRAIRKIAMDCAAQAGASRGWSARNARRARTMAESILVCLLTGRDVDAMVERYRDIGREVGHRYRAHKRGADGEHTQEEWHTLCAFFNNRCLRCGRSGRLALDHVMPLSKGGADHIGNAQPLCKSCNSFKHDRDFDYRPRHI